jgi:hypothetical protein
MKLLGRERLDVPLIAFGRKSHDTHQDARAADSPPSRTE